MPSPEAAVSTLERSEKVDPRPLNPKSNEVDDDGDDSDYTSSSGSSIEEIDDDDDDGESTTPGHQSSSTLQPMSSKNRPHDGLKSRLAAFLPQIERSNRELQSSDDIEAHRIDHLDENAENYVEMNLNLGVLSEQQSDDGEEIRVKDDSTDEDESQEEIMPVKKLHGLQGLQKSQTAKGNKKIEEL